MGCEKFGCLVPFYSCRKPPSTQHLEAVWGPLASTIVVDSLSTTSSKLCRRPLKVDRCKVWHTKCLGHKLCGGAMIRLVNLFVRFVRSVRVLKPAQGAGGNPVSKAHDPLIRAWSNSCCLVCCVFYTPPCVGGSRGVRPNYADGRLDWGRAPSLVTGCLHWTLSAPLLGMLLGLAGWLAGCRCGRHGCAGTFSVSRLVLWIVESGTYLKL